MPKPENLPVPRELTKAEAEAQRERVFEIVQRILQALKDGRKANWDTAHGFYDFFEVKGWAWLGYAELNEWLADPEVGVKRSTFYMYMEVWREFVVRRGFQPARLLDITKACETLPALRRGKVLLEDVIADIETLGKRDLREKYRQSKATPEKQDEHDDDELDEPQAHVKGEVIEGDVIGAADAGELDIALSEWHLFLHEFYETYPRAFDALAKLLDANVDPDLIMERDV